MHTICRLAGIIVATAILSAAIGTCAGDQAVPVPNVTVTAPAAPVEPPYLRNPWKSTSETPMPAAIAWRRINSPGAMYRDANRILRRWQVFAGLPAGAGNGSVCPKRRPQMRHGARRGHVPRRQFVD